MKTPRASGGIDRRTFLGRVAAFFAGTALLGHARRSEASEEPFIGEIMLFAGNFAPRGWAFCNGQVLPIAQNQALFSLLGTTYGGDGFTTFRLPDLRDRVPIHFGQGAGLSLRSLGEFAGASTHTITLTELPAHSHSLQGSRNFGAVVSPSGAYPSRNPSGIPEYGLTADVAMSPTAISTVGGSQAHENRQPYLAVNFCIALVGIFPSQN